ncbi:MAG: ferredoxin [Candidatus Omnitrophica bacterium CG11_big_fil_rev_8_21_14_0_20_64_10]|nr:MAG: ferredoxin [Candidatus Omnitrophica bacterium CG11_big_fil_rev_8_21_14_0_20_64_10]
MAPMKSGESPYLKHLFVCVNRRPAGEDCCAEKAGEAVKERLKSFVAANGLKGKVRISGSGCMDFCAKGGNVMVTPGRRWYSGVTPADVERIIALELAPLVSPKPVA